MNAPAPHMSVDELAGFLDGRLDAVTRSRIERHLAACDSCRDEWVAVSHLAPRPTRRFRPALVGGLVAAAIVIVALPSVSRRLTTPGRDQERTGARVGVLEVISPEDSVSDVAGALRLVWKGAGAGATYRVTISDSTGAVVWSGETRDTAVEILETTVLPAGSHFWFVDAILADGRSRTSGTRLFRVIR